MYSARYSAEEKRTRQNGALTTRNEKLKADVQNLRELLRHQGKTTSRKGKPAREVPGGFCFGFLIRFLR